MKMFIAKNFLTSLLMLATFFVLAPSANADQLKSLPDPLIAGWQGKKVCEKLVEDKQKRILRCTFAPGVGHERHYHVPHFGYALSGGKVKITSEKGVRKVNLKTGSYYSSEGTPWHEIINIGDTDVIYLIIETKESS